MESVLQHSNLLNEVSLESNVDPTPGLIIHRMWQGSWI